MTEEWREIPGYPGYEVSSLGGLRSWLKKGPGGGGLASPMNMQTRVHSSGYLTVNLRNKRGSQSTWLLHRLVLTAFRGACPTGMQARHVNDNNPLNCTLENLAWGTAQENSDDRFRHGTAASGVMCHRRRVPRGDEHHARARPSCMARGERHGGARISADIALQIRAAEGIHQSIANSFGVSKSLVAKIKRRALWSHL